MFAFGLPESYVWSVNQVETNFSFITEPDNNHNTLKSFIIIPGGHQNA